MKPPGTSWVCSLQDPILSTHVILNSRRMALLFRVTLGDRGSRTGVHSLRPGGQENALKASIFVFLDTDISQLKLQGGLLASGRA